MKNILIVDDNKDIAVLYKTFLDSSGHKCSIANCGKECLQLLNDKSFDLVLLDLAMPEMSGIDVLQVIRKDPKLKDNKVIVVTALSPSDKESEMIKNEYGVLSVVRKPISKDQLLMIIDKSL